jgi:beta-lactamase regulating signal transducer with metallopeptidase domain
MMVSIVLKVTVLFAVAATAQWVLRRRTSAAARHLIWTMTIAGALALPAAALVMPEWAFVYRTVPAEQRPAVEPVAADSAVPSSTSAPIASVAAHAETATTSTARRGATTWSAVFVRVYVAGALALMAVLVWQHWQARRFVRSAAPIVDPEWTRLLADCAARLRIRRPVRLLRSRERSVPITFGTRRPAIVVPAIADTWAADRRTAVLLHELAHVARFDCLTQAVAVAARAVYWFHPAAWWIAARVRAERELACDDLVIAAGTGAREYAGHLLEIAYSVGGHRAPALAVGMARRHQLESRLLAALDDSRNRRPPVRAAGLTIAAATTMVVLAIGSARAVVAIERPVEERHAAAQVPPELARLVERGTAAAARLLQVVLPGTWEIRPTATAGVVHLRLTEADSSTGSNVAIDQLQGLTAAQLTGEGGPIQFRLRRDAGTFAFEGVIRSGVGAGTFTFGPDAAFPPELAKRGYTRPTAREQYELARADVGYAFLDELAAQRYAKPSTADLVRAAQHGVGLTYLREMGALGHKLGSLEPLITLRDHGVTPGYIRDLAAEGYKELSAEQLRQARDHGISPEYVRGMRAAGYGGLTMDRLITARDHGVGPDYARAIGEAGYRNLPLEELIRVRDHGVSAEYIREMHQLGHKRPLPELVNARDHGVDPKFARELADAGYRTVSLEDLIRLRDHGVSPEYIRELKALGYDQVPIDDLISLRDHGVTPERIKMVNSRAGKRLPIDLLQSFVTGSRR